jgi:hypothetical protein
VTLTAKEAKTITQAALKAATLKEIEVRVEASRAGYLRFANNQAQTSGATERIEISVTASEGGRSATATGTARDAKGLAALVGRAEALARLSPVDPEQMPPLGPQRYVEGAARDPKVAALGADARAELAGKLMRPANKARLQAAGMVEHGRSGERAGEQRRLFAFYADTEVEVSMTCRTGGAGRSVGDLEVELVGAEPVRSDVDPILPSSGGGVPPGLLIVGRWEQHQRRRLPARESNVELLELCVLLGQPREQLGVLLEPLLDLERGAERRLELVEPWDEVGLELRDRSVSRLEEQLDSGLVVGGASARRLKLDHERALVRGELVALGRESLDLTAKIGEAAPQLASREPGLWRGVGRHLELTPRRARAQLRLHVGVEQADDPPGPDPRRALDHRRPVADQHPQPQRRRHPRAPADAGHAAPR